MKKRRILIISLVLVLILTALVGLVGCKEENTTKVEKTLQSIKIVGQDEYYIEDFDYTKDLKIEQAYSDGSKTYKKITEEMFGDKKDDTIEHLRFMNDDGTGKVAKTITINYMGKTASFTFNMVHKTIDKFPELKEFDENVKMDSLTIVYSPNPQTQESRHLKVVGVPRGIGATVEYSRNNNFVNAGEYEVIAKVSAPGYKTLELKNTLTIEKKTIAFPKTTILAPNGEDYLDIVKNADGTYYAGAVEYSGRRINAPINRDSKECRITGELVKKDANLDDETYSFKIALINDFNYVWEDGTSEPLDVNWEIIKKKIDLSGVIWKYGPGVTSNGFFLYNTVGKYRVEVDKYPKDLVKPVYLQPDEKDVKNPIRRIQNANEVGNYTAKVSFELKDEIVARNYEIDTTKQYPETFEWSIRHNRINLDERIKFAGAVDGLVIYTYNGEVHKPELVNVDSVISGATVTYSNDGHIDVGDYSITATISKEGYEPEQLSVNYSVQPRVVDIPQISDNHLYYNGVEQQVKFVNSDIQGITIKGCTYGIEPNEYQLTYILENTRNYVWNDGTTGIICNDDTKWGIYKIELPTTPFNWKTLKENDDLVYSGGLHIVGLDLNNQPGIAVSYKNNRQTNAGKYTATAEITLLYPKEMYTNATEFEANGLNQSNYEWTITPQPLSVDLGGVTWNNSTFIYKENILDEKYEVMLNLPEGAPSDLVKYVDNEVYIKDENGKYLDVEANKIFEPKIAKVIFSPNYDTSSYKGSMELTWEIKQKPMDGFVIYDNKTVVYDAEGYPLVKPTSVGGMLEDAKIWYYPDASQDVIDSTRKLYNVGTYKQKVIIEKQGYTAYENTIDFVITPQKIAKPELAYGADKFVFNGKMQSCGIESIAGKYKVDGTNVTNLAGKYEIKVTLASENYEWETGETAPIAYTWTINKLNFNPSNAWDYSQPVEYNGIPQQVQLQNLPDGIVAVYTTTQNGVEVSKPINKGSYSTNVKLKAVFDDEALIQQCYENYQAISNFNGNINWEIAPRKVDVSGIKWEANGGKSPLIYEEDITGVAKVHTVNLVNIPTILQGMFTITGVLSASEVSVVPNIAKATFNDELGNYELIGCPTGDNTWKLSWEIKRNDLDWVYFEKEYIFDFAIKEGASSIEGEPNKPEVVINHSNKDNIIKELESGNEKYRITFLSSDKDGNTYKTGEVTEVGTYRYLAEIKFAGYGTKYQVITLKINPLKISKPTVDTSQLNKLGFVNGTDGVYSIKYDAMEHSVPITHTASNYEMCYRMHESTMTSVGNFDVRAELLSRNLVWDDGTAGDCNLGFKWKIVPTTISFVVNDGTVVESIEYSGGTKVMLPVPVKDGFTFDGWYTDDMYQTKFDAEAYSHAPKDITLYGKFV